MRVFVHFVYLYFDSILNIISIQLRGYFLFRTIFFLNIENCISNLVVVFFGLKLENHSFTLFTVVTITWMELTTAIGREKIGQQQTLVCNQKECVCKCVSFVCTVCNYKFQIKSSNSVESNSTRFECLLRFVAEYISFECFTLKQWS